MKSGTAIHPNISPRALAQHAVSHFGNSAKPLAAWLIQLEELRYQKRPSHDDISSMKSDLKKIAWPVK
jgi:hypothetical protein